MDAATEIRIDQRRWPTRAKKNVVATKHMVMKGRPSPARQRRTIVAVKRC